MKALIIENGHIADVHPVGFPVVPEWQWVDCPDDCQPHLWTWNGSTCEPPPTPPDLSAEEIRTQLTQAVQRHLDTTAKSHGYDGILSLCTYATSTHAKFAAEGQAGVVWRDAVWAYCWQVMAEVEAGTRAIPTADELVTELPVMTWPAA